MIKVSSFVSGCMSVAIVAASFSSLPQTNFSQVESTSQTTAAVSELGDNEALTAIADNSLTPNPPKMSEEQEMLISQDEIEGKGSPTSSPSAGVSLKATDAPSASPSPVATPSATVSATPSASVSPSPKVSVTPTPTTAPATTAPAVEQKTTVSGNIAVARDVKANLGEVIAVEGKVDVLTFARRVILEKQSGSSWVTVASQSTSLDGKFSFNVKFDGTNFGSYRIQVAKVAGWSGYVSPITSISDSRKFATVTYSNLNTTINKTSSSTGLVGTIIYRAPSGTIGNSTLTVWRKLSTTNKWEVFGTLNISGSTQYYSSPLSDKNWGLSSGSVAYKIEMKTDTAKNVVQLPAQFSVSYSKATTTVTGSNLAGKTLTVDRMDYTKITGVVSNSTIYSRLVEIQRYNAKTKKWEVVRNVWTDKSKRFNVNLPYYSTISEQFRVVVPATLTDSQYVGTATTVAIKKAKYTTSYTTVLQSKTVPWQSNSVYVYVLTNPSRPYDIKPRVYLQKYVGGKWVVVNSVVGYGNITLGIPKGNTSSANGVQSYRVNVGTTTVAETTVSGVVRTTWENPYRYTGMQRSIYNYFKAYCPTTLVTVKKQPSGIWGRAFLGGNKQVEVSPSVPAQHLRTVALHECAHIRQGEIYINSWDNFRKKMNSVYGQSQNGSKGLEQNADCIANIYARNSYWAYGGNCNGARYTAAKAISQGKKY